MAKGFVHDLKKEGEAEWNVARYIPERSVHFEVAVDPDLAAKFVEGKIQNVSEVLMSEEIFTDTKKGLRPNESELEKYFGTKDRLKIAETILKKGIIQYSSEYRDEQKETKKRRLMELVRINCIDAQTGHPLPLQRIENAFEEAKIRVKEGKSAEDQLQETVKELRKILPIKMDMKTFKVSIPSKYSSRMHGILKQYGKISNERWGSDSSLSCEIELPAGLSEEFFDKVNEMTHGDAQIEENR